MNRLLLLHQTSRLHIPGNINFVVGVLKTSQLCHIKLHCVCCKRMSPGDRISGYFDWTLKVAAKC